MYRPDGIVLYGEYDTADLTYYAAEASEASHTIPPMASYYSGHKLNAAYYPHLVFAMIHRFASVPVLSIYFAYAWPTFLVLSALTGFVLVRALASRAVAVLAIALVLVGSDFSYLAAWYLPDAQNSGAWDYILWPTNFLSPTMQILHFNTWGMSLPLFFTVLYAMVRGLQTRSRGWIVLSAFLLAMLFEFRPFSYVVLMAALGGGRGLFRPRRRGSLAFRGHAALGVVFSIPFVYAALTIAPEDRRSRLVIEFFPLVKRMLIKTGLTDTFANFTASRRALGAASHARVSVAGHDRLSRDRRRRPVGRDPRRLARHPPPAPVTDAVGEVPVPGTWPPGACSAGPSLAGIAIPFVLATEPYVDTLNFYVTGLYVMWIFAASALVSFAAKHPRIGVVALPVAIALTLPSSTALSRAAVDRSGAAGEGRYRRGRDQDCGVSPEQDRRRDHGGSAQPAAVAVPDNDSRGAADRARLGRDLLGRGWPGPAARRQPVLRVGRRQCRSRVRDARPLCRDARHREGRGSRPSRCPGPAAPGDAIPRRRPLYGPVACPAVNGRPGSPFQPNYHMTKAFRPATLHWAAPSSEAGVRFCSITVQRV